MGVDITLRGDDTTEERAANIVRAMPVAMSAETRDLVTLDVLRVLLAYERMDRATDKACGLQ